VGRRRDPGGRRRPAPRRSHLHAAAAAPLTGTAAVLYWRIAAVALTALFAVLLIWLYGVRTTLIWAAAMAAFLFILWLATVPLRARQRRVWREMGLGPDGRPLPEEEDDEAPGGAEGGRSSDRR